MSENESKESKNMASKHIKHGPTDLEWSEIRKTARRLGRVKSSGMLSPNASSLDKMKYDLCKRLLVYMRENDLTQRQLAKELGVVESRVSEVLHYRIEKITLDRLVKYHQTIDPKFALKVA
jgi:predicted XRE-type DNA-binding protein